MSDVAINPVTGQPVHNGWALVYADKLGNTQVLAPIIDEDNISASGLVAKYDNRFDDPTYYTA